MMKMKWKEREATIIKFFNFVIFFHLFIFMNLFYSPLCRSGKES